MNESDSGWYFLNMFKPQADKALVRVSVINVVNMIKSFQGTVVTDPNMCGFGFTYILGIIFNM